MNPQSYYLIDLVNSYLFSLYPVLINGLIRVLVAVLVILFGWLISYFVRSGVERALDKVRFGELLEKANLRQYFEEFEFEEKASTIVSDAVFWLVFLLFFMTASDVLGLNVVSSFLRDLLYFIPKAVAGILILLAGFVFGDLVKKILSGFLKSLEKKTANFLSSLAKWAIVVFAFFATLNQWGIANEVVNTLLFGLVLFFGLAGGLAFGLGGQELAREILESLRKKFK